MTGAPVLPHRGRGTIRRMVEGACGNRRILEQAPSTTVPVPPSRYAPGRDWIPNAPSTRTIHRWIAG
jgi:hypothetical protein